MRGLVPIVCALGASTFACTSADAPAPTSVPEAPRASAVLRRLTAEQFRRSVVDLFGPSIILTQPVEPDLPAHGLRSVGASETTISAWGVEQYESIALDLAEQAMASSTISAALGAGEHSGVVDLDATRSFARRFARKAWRRPATDEELTRLARTGTTAAGVLESYSAGLELVIAAVLQSPSFLFRAELGGADGKLDRYELASRLSFFVWNAPPDDALLDAAEAGALDTDEGLKREAARLLDSPRARDGVRAFFSDLFQLAALDALTKDPTIFPHFSADLGASAREQTLHDLEALVLGEDGDYRDLFVREQTWVDRRLAAIYRVRAPKTGDEFGEVTMTEAAGRRGILGHVSVLALHSHPVSTSATLRGRFVRETLLCDEVPPPPAGVNTALPEPTGTARTLRERVKEHLQNPTCNGCHQYMDPIGLGLETFDGIGRARTMDHGAPIDSSSDVDGVSFKDAWALGEVLRAHPAVPRCLIRNMYRYATGALDPRASAESDPLIGLTERFAAHGYRVKPMMLDLIRSAAFREVNPP